MIFAVDSCKTCFLYLDFLSLVAGSDKLLVGSVPKEVQT